MKRKIEETYVTEALGFPITLRNVSMRQFRGDWVPEINWDRLQEVVMLALAHKPVPLSGNEVRFVRHFLGLTLKDFAHTCGMSSHQSVMNWESKEDKPTGMRKSTEILLRARILQALPEKLWDRIETTDSSPKESFSQRLHELSEFDTSHDSVTLSILPESDRNEELRYRFA